MFMYIVMSQNNVRRTRVYKKKPKANPGRQFRPAPTYSGKSNYVKRYPTSKSSSIGATIGGGIGSMVGGPVGARIGSGLGELAQGLLKKFTGYGDYTIEVNSLMGGRFAPAELVNQSQRHICLRHREYIGDVTASANFTVTSYDINPGLFTSFPWLAGVANNYEEYQISGMIFEYKSLSADYTTAASAALGYVAMATQYNPLLPIFQDKVHMENYEFANSAKPSENFVHPIECKRSLNPVNQLYVRTGPVPNNADQRLYDLGKFQIATGGNSGSGVLGELWCTYEICFYKPKLVDQDDTILSSHWRLSSVLAATPLGNSQLADPDNTLDIDFSTSTMTFPSTMTVGKFLILWNCVGSSTASLVAPVITATSNCSLVTDWVNHTDTKFQTQNGVTSTSQFVAWVLEITGASAVCTVGVAGTIPASVTSADLHIAQMIT